MRQSLSNESEKRQMNKGQEGDGIGTEGRYKKELTVIVEMVGVEKISAMELMRKVKEVCGELLACRSVGERTYEITMSMPSGKEKVMDGFRIREVSVMGKELSNDEMMVSFMGLPVYTTDEEIKEKLNLWGVSAVSPVRRRMWPGTQIADGTRLVRVKFNNTVQSLPYSTKFDTVTGPEYVRVIHDRQVRVCRLCIQPGHILRDCPEFTCFKCHKQGHYARECVSGDGRGREESGDEERHAEGGGDGNEDEAEDGGAWSADADDGEVASGEVTSRVAAKQEGAGDGGCGEQEDEAESSSGGEMEEEEEQMGDSEMVVEKTPEQQIGSSLDSHVRQHPAVADGGSGRSGERAPRRTTPANVTDSIRDKQHGDGNRDEEEAEMDLNLETESKNRPQKERKVEETTKKRKAVLQAEEKRRKKEERRTK